jgi:surfeit locus 1 family protein
VRLVTGAAFVLIWIAFIGLGVWQLNRAEEKRMLFRAFDSSDSAQPLRALVPNDLLERYRYTRLELRGSFASLRQILLDSMTRSGQLGYQVLTPFQISNSENWIIVNRGWLAAPRNDEPLPDLSVSEGARIVRGRIDSLPRPGLRLSSPASQQPATWPRKLLFPSMKEIANVLELPVVEYQLLLDANEPDGFVREWQPRSMPPERHTAYAVQWFGLALVQAGFAIALAMRRLRRRSSETQSP